MIFYKRLFEGLRLSEMGDSLLGDFSPLESYSEHSLLEDF